MFNKLKRKDVVNPLAKLRTRTLLFTRVASDPVDDVIFL